MVLIADVCFSIWALISFLLFRGIAKSLKGHTKPVTSLNWSYNGQLLLSGSSDNTVIQWDVKTSQPLVQAIVPGNGKGIKAVQMNRKDR